MGFVDSKLVLLMVSGLSVFYDEMVLMSSNYVCRDIIITVVSY